MVLYFVYIKILTDLLIPSFVYFYFTFCEIRSHEKLTNIPKKKFSEKFYVLSKVISGNCTRLRVHTSSKIDGFLKFVPISHDANDKKKKRWNQGGNRRMQKAISRKGKMKRRRRHGLTALGGWKPVLS